MKYLRKIICLALFSILACLWQTGGASAASGNIAFSTDNDQPQVGDTFTVVCRVSSAATFMDADFYVYYDAEKLTFVSGGSKVEGGNGTLHLKTTGNKTPVYERIFSLQFRAKKDGGNIISLGEPATITGSDEKQLSLSSDRLSITILKKGQKAGDPNIPKSSDTGTGNEKTSDATVTYLVTNAVKMTPKFLSGTTKYDVIVDSSTSILFFDYRLTNPNASVSVEGNNNLQAGSNTVTLTVRPQVGYSKKYVFHVVKETEEETALRKIEEGETAISVRVTNKDGEIVIQNQYQFQVLDVADAKMMPKGYVETKVKIAGVEVPAYTMSSQLDSNYLLLYLKGPNGKANVYQYDREEQTLQRYTGEMTERINKNGTNSAWGSTGAGSSQLTVMFFVIIILIIIILVLLSLLLKMIVKCRKKKNDYHELDL